MRDEFCRSVRGAALWLASLGAVYALFCVVLFRAGVVGRDVLLSVALERYYVWQAFFVGPFLASLVILYAWLVWRLAGGSALRSSFGDAWVMLVLRYAGWTLFGFVVPDLAVFLAAGPGALARAMRWYGAVAPLGIVASSVAPLGRLSGASSARALGAALLALLAQALVGVPFLR